MALDATGTPTSPDSLPKYNTAVDPPSGKGFNAAMDAIQLALASRLFADSVTVAGTRILANKLLLADAQPAFRIMGDGKLEWGAGGASALDTNLYRSGANALKSDGSVLAMLGLFSTAGTSGPGLQVYGTGGGAVDTRIKGDGHIEWGAAGTEVWDTKLYRSGADSLRTDSDFAAEGYVVANAGAAGQISLAADGRMYFGSAADTNLFRTSADVLRTDDTFQAGGSLNVSGDITTNQYYYAGSLAAGNAAFIGRAAGDVDNRFTLANDGKHYWGDGVSAADTTLYRVAANVLKTDDALEAISYLLTSDNLYVYNNTGKLVFGTGQDVSIERTGANEISMTTGDTFKLAAVGLKFNDGTVQTTAAAGAAALVPATTLPGSPTNGQQAILTDSTTAPTYNWLFQYDTTISDSNKWRYIGGVPLDAYGYASKSTASYSDLATYTLPRAGVYMVQFTASARLTGGANTANVRLVVNGGVIANIETSGVSTQWMHYAAPHTLASASQIIKVEYTSNGTDSYIAASQLQITPVRVA